MTRVVLDTNVLLSAAIRPGGKPDQVLHEFPGRYELIVSEHILTELERVVARRHIQLKYREQVMPPKWKLFIARLRALAVIVDVVSDLQRVVSDPDDEAVLATAIDGVAEYLVTGDRHLLKLKSFRTVQMVTPEEFLKIAHA